jgi:hypothetical protein
MKADALPAAPVLGSLLRIPIGDPELVAAEIVERFGPRFAAQLGIELGRLAAEVAS